MNGTVLFLLLCALGSLCYWFYSNVWIGLKKFNKNVYRIAYSEYHRIHLLDVCAR